MSGRKLSLDDLPLSASDTLGIARSSFLSKLLRKRYLLLVLVPVIIWCTGVTRYIAAIVPQARVGNEFKEYPSMHPDFRPGSPFNAAVADGRDCIIFLNPSIHPGDILAPSTQYDFNTSDIRFFLVGSHSTMLTGSVNVSTRPVNDDSDTAILTIQPVYLDPNTDVEAIVCVNREYPNQIVFEIYTSEEQQSPPKVFLQMNLLLPHDRDDEPVPDLMFLSLPNFSFNFADTKGATLDLVRLYGGDSTFNIDYISSNDLLILNQGDGSISGYFDVSRRLTLQTDYGDITVNADLLDDQEIPKWPAVLELSTLKGQIDARLNLIAATGKDGKFDLSVLAKHGPLNLAIDMAPVDSIIRLTALTTESNAAVELPPTYEGAFTLHSTKKPEVFVDEAVEDPTGRGRKRSFEKLREGAEVHGNVTWSGNYLGSVEVGTLDASAYLRL